MTTIQFLGATDTVTGSRFLLTHNKKKILIDCGLFQGYKHLRLRNWNPFPVNPKEIDAVLFTHAHLDHTGYFPRLVKEGFRKKVYTTKACRSLCSILLPDSAYLQEEDARFLNKHKLTKHKPALPLYTVEEANQSLDHIHAVDWNTPTTVAEFTFRFLPVAHLLGAGLIEVSVGRKKIIFSGDVGRTNDPFLKQRSQLPKADYLVLESTYGERLHSKEDANDQLALIINNTLKRGGITLIPTFAVGRAQYILYMIDQLKRKKQIPDLPVYLNSPMAIDATQAHYLFTDDLKISKKKLEQAFSRVNFIHRDVESRQLNDSKKPSIILSSSGMLTGGRVLHHVKSMAPNPLNSIVIVGFQVSGTRGEAIMNGKKELKIHGQVIPINAEVHVIDNLSSHADYEEIIEWLDSSPIAPRKTFLVHGEPTAREEMSKQIEKRLKWSCTTPGYLEEISL